jgi:uncharacterized protein YybS (DUF2232 family)
MNAYHFLGCVGTALALLLASVWIPVAGPFVSLLTPLPFLYYSAKLGVPGAVKLTCASILASGLIAAVTRQPQLIFLCVEFSILGLILSEMFRRKLPIGMSVLLGTCLLLILGLVVLSVAGLRKNMGPLDVVHAYLLESLEETARLYAQGGADPEKGGEFQEYLETLRQGIALVYPSLMVLASAFVVWLNVILSRPLFRRRNLEAPDYGALDRWRSPEGMVWGVIVAGFSLFLPFSPLRLVAVNALIVLLAIYFFHGLSIILFYLNRYRVPPWMRLGVYALILVQQVLVIGVTMAGLFDQWLDLRRIHQKKPELGRNNS